MLKVLLISIMLLSMARCSRIDPCGPLPTDGEETLAPTFTSVEGRFKIDLPPTKSETEVDESKGYNDTSFKWFILNRGHFQVSYFDSPHVLETPENSEALINNFREATRSTSGEVEVDAEIRLSGHPGRELRIKDKHSYRIERFYVVNKRLYMVNAFVPDELNCGLDNVLKRLDSFELIEESGVASTLMPK